MFKMKVILMLELLNGMYSIIAYKGKSNLLEFVH